MTKSTNSGRGKLRRLFSAFPSGLPGAAILLLRVTLALTVFVRGRIYLTERFETTIWNWFVGLFSIICGAALLIGFLTPLFSTLICAAAIFTSIPLISQAARAIAHGSLDFNFSIVYPIVIARKLFITEETVKVHVRHIMEKLGASDRTQAVAIALRRGIIQL